MMIAVARETGKLRKLLQRYVHSKRSTARLKAAHRASKGLRESLRFDQPLIKQLWPDIRDYRATQHYLSTLQSHSTDALIVNQHLANW
jgi:hypothetical protein